MFCGTSISNHCEKLLCLTKIVIWNTNILINIISALSRIVFIFLPRHTSANSTNNVVIRLPNWRVWFSLASLHDKDHVILFSATSSATSCYNTSGEPFPTLSMRNFLLGSDPIQQTNNPPMYSVLFFPISWKLKWDVAASQSLFPPHLNLWTRNSRFSQGVSQEFGSVTWTHINSSTSVQPC